MTTPDGLDMTRLMTEFVAEGRELLASAEETLLAIESGKADADAVRSLFRAFHTIKGSAGFLGLESIGTLTHAAEDVLNRLRKGEMTPSPAMFQALLGAVDASRRLLDDAATGTPTLPAPADLVQSLRSLLAPSGAAGGPPPKPPVPAAPAPRSGDEAMALVEAMLKEAPPPAMAGETRVIRAPAPAATAPRTSEETIALVEAMLKEAPKTAPPTVESETRRMKAPAQANTTIRVDVARLESLMNLMGEIVLGRNALLQSHARAAARDATPAARERLSQAVVRLSGLVTGLQGVVMKLRMLPVGAVFQRFPRTVRDLALAAGKEVALELEGSDIELDKSLVDELGPPLVHLLRNAIDHGIEPPEERVRLGKPRLGIIRLKASCEGESAVLLVRDDGRGIDGRRLIDTSLRRGLITQEDAGILTDEQGVDLMFLPGVSTAEKVGELSGRGVGMDVVKDTITRLGGTIAIETELGKGALFTIRLPLTLAVQRVLLVGAANMVVAIPLSSILEIVRLRPGDLQTLNGREVFRRRGRVHPLLRLRDVLAVGRTAEEQRDGDPYVLVIGAAERRVGIAAERLVGQEEVVKKSLGAYLHDLPGIAGASLLGDGTPVLILNAAALAESSVRRMS